MGWSARGQCAQCGRSFKFFSAETAKLPRHKTVKGGSEWCRLEGTLPTALTEVRVRTTQSVETWLPDPAEDPARFAKEARSHPDRLIPPDAVMQLRALTGPTFERLVGALLVADGHHPVLTSGGPGDGGVDVRAGKLKKREAEDPPVLLVQCKRQIQPLSAAPIRQLAGSVMLSQARGLPTKGLLVTTARLTAPAQKELFGFQPTIRVLSDQKFLKWVRGQTSTMPRPSRDEQLAGN